VTKARPKGVSAAPPPPPPPARFSTTGLRKQRLTSSISSQARRYDMPMSRPAAAIEPLASISSSRRILPGPTASSPLNSMRRLSVAIGRLDADRAAKPSHHGLRGFARSCDISARI
jgi:hypothetical protein